jgi:single-strand DNA-binding protein
MNVWCFSGNLGADCEVRHTPKGDVVTTFRVGVKSGFGDKAKTVWARCQIWGKRGESVAPYLVKGQLVGVSGELSTDEYAKKDGGTGFSLDVRVNDVTLLGKRDDTDAAPARQQAPRPQSQQAPQQGGGGFGDFSDDIPFNSIGRGIHAYSV